MCCGRVVWDFISVLRFIQHDIDSFNSCESCNITFPLLPCGFHIMAAIQIGRQWHSIQPMNSKLRGWSKTDTKPKKFKNALILWTYEKCFYLTWWICEVDKFNIILLWNTCCPQKFFLNNSGNKTLQNDCLLYTNNSIQQYTPRMLPKQLFIFHCFCTTF